MSPAERVGIAIGSAGLALSIYNTWRQWRADRPRLRVELRRSTLSDNLPRWLEPLVAGGERWLEVRIANHGRHSVVLNGIGFLSSTQWLLDMSAWEQSLPHGSWPERFSELRPGRAASIYLEERFVVEGLKRDGQKDRMRVRACCWDQLDNLYRSGPVKLVGPSRGETKNA